MGFIFENFSLGWQNRAGHELMKDEALYKCIDLDMLELGVLRCCRSGQEEEYFKSDYFTSSIKNIFQLDVEGKGVKLIYYTYEGNLYRYNSFTKTSSAISSDINEQNVSYTPFKPLLSQITYIYITDGNTMLCDNGVSSFTWGIDPPQNPLMAYMAGSGGGLASGDYTWQFTYYDALTGAESNPSPLMGPVTSAGSDSADVKGLELSSNERVTSRRLYRSLVDGGSHYLVRDIGDNVSTSFIDISSDDLLTTLMETDQGVPPSFSICKAFQNRIFGAVSSLYPNRVWYSRGGRPDNWPSDYYLEVGTADDHIVDILEFEGTLFFLQQAAISGLYGTTPESFDWYKTRSHIGIAGRYSASVGPDGIYFLGFDGVYRFDGVKSVRVSEQIGRTFGKLADDWVDIIDWDLADSVCRSCLLNGVFYILVPVVDNAGGKSNRLYSYDIFQQVWQEYSLDLDYLYSDKGRGKVYGSMLLGSRYSVLELFEVSNSLLGYQDPAPEFVTKSVEFGRTKDGNRVKWIRRFRVDATGDWTLYFYIDNVLRYTKTLTGLSKRDKYKWYDFGEEIKGISLYVRIFGGGNSTAVEETFSSLEVD